jgi:5'-nucleotidase
MDQVPAGAKPGFPGLRPPLRSNTTATEVKAGDAITLAVSKLDLTSLGSPVNTSLRAEFTDAAGTVTALGTVPVTAGAASVSLAVPTGAASGAGTLGLTAVESGTVARTAVKVAASVPAQPVCTAPVKPRPGDLAGQMNYGQAMSAYRHCLKGLKG